MERVSHSKSLALVLFVLITSGCSAAAPTPMSAPTSATGSTTAQPAARGDRVHGWQSDIDFLLAAIRREHFIYHTQPLPGALERQAEALKQTVPNLSDERLLAELERLMTLLGDGHSYILPVGARGVQSTYLPLRFYLFSDGLYVIDADPLYKHWIGYRVRQLGTLSVTDAMAQMADFTSRDNAMGIAWIAPFLLRFRGFLEALGTPIDAQGLRIQFGDRQGGGITDTIPFVPVPTWRGGVPKLIASQLPGAPPAPLYLSNVATPYWFKDLPEKNAMYVQFNQVMDDPAEALGTFAQRLRTSLTGHPPQRLIVDVRHNNGGNADLLPPLLAVLRDFEATHPHAQLVVLTGRNTFSAAQIFIAQVDRDTKAIFAGEPSSSKPNFVGEENQITLPWSGAIGSISNRYHETIPEDTRSWIEPTIKVELTARDYFANRDPVFDAVLEQLKQS